MLRLTAVFVAICVVTIAASLGAVAYLAAGFSLPESIIAALAVLTILTLYNMVSSRLRDRAHLGDQIGDLSRGTADLARQVAEIGRRVATLEGEQKTAIGRAKAAADPLAAEIGELGTLIRQLAETVAAHESALSLLPIQAGQLPANDISAPNSGSLPATGLLRSADIPATGPFKGRSNEEILATIAAAIDAGRIDLYLQPIVTLPQRKVRYYEGMTRLRTDEGDLILPADFLPHAERSGLMGRIDNLQLFRCVQVLRRLLGNNREIGLFCNVSAATLQDAESFAQFSQFMEANRALGATLILEFSQSVFRAMGPVEQEHLAALADAGFRFSMDHVGDLRIEPRQLSERGVRFVKVPANVLLSRITPAADIRAEDLSDLLGRHGISLIAEKIETEAVVVDLLDYDVRFGQGFLFSPPRPVRAEALAGGEPDLRETADPRAPEPARRAEPGMAQRAV